MGVVVVVDVVVTTGEKSQLPGLTKINETQCSMKNIFLKAFVQCNQILSDMFVKLFFQYTFFFFFS